MQCLNHPEADQDVVRCLRCQQPFCPDCVVMLKGYWYCGPCKDEVVRDIQSGTVGMADLASIGQRILAAILDGLLQSVAMMILFVPLVFAVGGLAVLGGSAEGGPASQAAEAATVVGVMVFYAIMFALSVGVPLCYEALFVARNGQTPGKMVVSIRVVSIDGTPATRGQAWGRAAIKVGLAQACSCLGFLADDLPACFTTERTALHDMAASTRVVRAL
jgi:uncharacterized RDD family membrane protein YckC